MDLLQIEAAAHRAWRAEIVGISANPLFITHHSLYHFD